MHSQKPAVPQPDSGLLRVRMNLAYDGGPFSGWAIQPGLLTVQGVLEEALATLLRRPFSINTADQLSGIITIHFRVIGRGTGWFTRLRPGDLVDLLGPLGRRVVRADRPRRPTAAWWDD